MSPALALTRARALLRYAERLEYRHVSAADARLEGLDLLSRARHAAEPDDRAALDALALRLRAPAQSCYR